MEIIQIGFIVPDIVVSVDLYRVPAGFDADIVLFNDIINKNGLCDPVNPDTALIIPCNIVVGNESPHVSCNEHTVVVVFDDAVTDHRRLVAGYFDPGKLAPVLTVLYGKTNNPSFDHFIHDYRVSLAFTVDNGPGRIVFGNNPHGIIDDNVLTVGSFAYPYGAATSPVGRIDSLLDSPVLSGNCYTILFISGSSADDNRPHIVSAETARRRIACSCYVERITAVYQGMGKIVGILPVACLSVTVCTVIVQG